MRVNFTSEPSTLDPRKGGDITSSTLHFMLFEGLMRYAPLGEEKFGMAERIERSENGMFYTFYLRESCWSDGHPVTAHDFEFAFTSMLSPDFPCPNANLLYPIKNARKAKEGKVPLSEVGVKALDDKTLVIELAHPTPYFLNLLAFCVFSPVPKHIVKDNPHWIDTMGPQAVTNGPFRLAAWKHQNDLELKRNEYYWQKEQIFLSGIKASLVEDEMTTLEMYRKGQLDALGAPFSAIPVDAAADLIEQGELIPNDSAGTVFIAFNLSRSPFDNRNIRKAFSLAIDRATIVQNITLMKERLAVGMTPPILKHPSQKDFTLEYHPQRAREFLEKGLSELGLTRDDLKDLEYIFTSSDAHKRLAQALQDQWRRVLGVEVSLHALEHKIYLDRLVTRNFDLSQSYLLAQYDDQMNILDRFKFLDNPKNHPGWYNSEYARLLDESLYAPHDTRYALLTHAEEILLEESPVAPIYHWTSCSLINPKISGIYRSPIGSFHWQGVRFDD